MTKDETEWTSSAMLGEGVFVVFMVDSLSSWDSVQPYNIVMLVKG
ncbi:hypothetical protein [Paenibacillus barcinonensis]|nr:hypothetical protein [Paenibacillus barcinonensis]